MEVGNEVAAAVAERKDIEREVAAEAKDVKAALQALIRWGYDVASVEAVEDGGAVVAEG